MSKKHCGFVINADGAICKDVLTLIDIIKTVKDNYDVELEREIKLLEKIYNEIVWRLSYTYNIQSWNGKYRR